MQFEFFADWKNLSINLQFPTSLLGQHQHLNVKDNVKEGRDEGEGGYGKFAAFFVLLCFFIQYLLLHEGIHWAGNSSCYVVKRVGGSSWDGEVLCCCDNYLVDAKTMIWMGTIRLWMGWLHSAFVCLIGRVKENIRRMRLFTIQCEEDQMCIAHGIIRIGKGKKKEGDDHSLSWSCVTETKTNRHQRYIPWVVREKRRRAWMHTCFENKI